MRFFEKQGYKWCRIFLLRTGGGRKHLQGLVEYGLTDPGARERFRKGEVEFDPQRDPQPWFVLTGQEDEPCEYEHRENHPPEAAPRRAGDSEGKPLLYHTNDRRYRDLFQQADATWLEAPLRFGGKSLGIISLAKPDKQLPEDWELLRSEIFAVSLALDRADQDGAPDLDSVCG